MSRDSKQERLANAYALVQKCQRELAEAVEYLAKLEKRKPGRAPCCERAYLQGVRDCEEEQAKFERVRAAFEREINPA